MVNDTLTCSRSIPIVRAAAAILIMVSVWGIVGCAAEQKYQVEYEPPSSFLLGPEDVLTVTVWRNQDLSREVVVRPDGMISMPLIGDVPAAGVSTDVLAKRIAERLVEYMGNPTVSVQVKEVKSYYIYVVGEVTKPGKYPLQSYATVLQGISLANGFTPFASKNKMHVVRMVRNGTGRMEEVRIPVGYDDLVAGKSKVGNFILRSGDTIVVP
ncbi:MAG TPA: polysaccharide biosynthesis/export family protein [Nitrospiraceae bacterium]|jgi:polysaccharide export outer membrane protein|nr:polysaccharide biosynthesis/export family protein [Nitrospiraceae bacterium]